MPNHVPIVLVRTRGIHCTVLDGGHDGWCTHSNSACKRVVRNDQKWLAPSDEPIGNVYSWSGLYCWNCWTSLSHCLATCALGIQTHHKWIPANLTLGLNSCLSCFVANAACCLEQMLDCWQANEKCFLQQNCEVLYCHLRQWHTCRMQYTFLVWEFLSCMHGTTCVSACLTCSKSCFCGNYFHQTCPNMPRFGPFFTFGCSISACQVYNKNLAKHGHQF